MNILTELFYRARGLSVSDESTLRALERLLSAADYKQLREIISMRQAVFKQERYPVTSALLPESTYTTITPSAKNAAVNTHFAALNAALRILADKERFAQFAPNAREQLRTLIAPHLLGLDAAKDAVALQLVMPERFHILLLGDPGTGKTDLLRAACDLAVVSAFGLGSGASKAGLSATAVGKEIRPGILPKANGGLCAIDELNLLKAEDRGALYNAMEKGFLSFDKGGVHARLDADIRLLATANPKGDRFTGETIASMRKQLPFDAALLSRFNLLCIVRKPTGDAFRDISLHAIRSTGNAVPAEDIQFAKAYIAHARTLRPKLASAEENALVDAVAKIREHEDTVLIEVTPRLATGLRSLALAVARLSLRTEVTAGDAAEAIALLQASLTAGLPPSAAAASTRIVLPKGRTKAAKTGRKSPTSKR